jgi:hypothetical protein
MPSLPRKGVVSRLKMADRRCVADCSGNRISSRVRVHQRAGSPFTTAGLVERAAWPSNLVLKAYRVSAFAPRLSFGRGEVPPSNLHIPLSTKRPRRRWPQIILPVALEHLVAGRAELGAVLLKAGQNGEVALIDHPTAVALNVARTGRLLLGRAAALLLGKGAGGNRYREQCEPREKFKHHRPCCFLWEVTRFEPHSLGERRPGQPWLSDKKQDAAGLGWGLWARAAPCFARSWMVI